MRHAYDNNGNTIGKAAGTRLDVYSYNLYNQLTGNIIGGVSAAYTYNAKGIRTSKTVGTDVTSFILDGGNVVAEVKGTAVTDYVRGINLICTDSEYYIYNAHGDVVSLTSTIGIVTKTYDYDAFGNEANQSDTDANPFRYCGEYYDTETGTYYLRARYYDPAVGRFGTEDPVHDGLNWYTYCGGNALRRIDPDGENWKDILVGAVVSLDENLTGGFVLWALEQITGKDELALESKYDFYEGKLVGDVISTVVGIKSTVDGVKTIIGSIGGGAAITIGSGGTAAVAGVAVSVGGVAIGTAEIGYGCVVLSKAINNYSDDLSKRDDIGKTERKKPISGSQKERSTDVPSWARGEAPYKNENGKQFAKRLCDAKYGAGNYDTGVNSDYNKIKKWGDRNFK